MKRPPHPARRPAAGTPEDPVLGAGVILWRRGLDGPEFLLLRNALHRTWGFPKGHLDADDPDPVAGALREVLEETGVRLTEEQLTAGFADVSSYRPKQRWKRVVLYLAEFPEGQELAVSSEHDRWGWFGREQALALLEHQELRRSLVRAAFRVG
ncbi:MAG: NUDIX domain-containing protein [Planctomycetes bacterium]|nr:NUDIX domain-containing protein [Planctomycetota bacterium]